MSFKLERSIDPDDQSTFVNIITKPFGSVVPITFSDIKYLNTKPTEISGLVFKFIVKNDPDGLDSEAIINIGNAELVITENPLTIAYNIDTTIDGFSKNNTYYAELWVEGSLGTDRLSKINIKLTDPYRETFE